MVRLRGTRPGVKAEPKLRVTTAQVPPPGYVAGAGARPGLKMDWSRDLQAFFQYGAAAQLPGWQLSCHPLLPGRQLSCHHLLPGWQLSCHLLLPGGGSSAARLAAQLPDLGSSAAERCNDNCMHAFNHPAKSAPGGRAPAKLRPQG